jgi:hypothetical protein
MIDTTTKSLNSSLLRQVSLISPSKLQAEKALEEGGIIADTFFGQLQSFIQYKDSQDNVKF